MVKSGHIIGFILHGDNIPAWYAYTIEKLVAGNKWRIFYVRAPPLPSAARAWVAKLYSKLESKRHQHKYQADLLVSPPAGFPTIHIHSPFYNIDENEKAAISNFHPDLLYTIHPYPKEENLSSLAPFGLWYPYFGSENRTSRLPVYFQEIMEGNQTVASGLIMQQGGNRRTIYHGITTPVPHSVLNTYNTLAWKTAGFLLYRLETLLAFPGQFKTLFPFVGTSGNIAENENSPFRLISGIAQNFRKYLQYRKRSKQPGSFRLYLSPKTAFDNTSPGDFREIVPPRNHFYADPFFQEANGNQYLFFEDHDDSLGKAHISMIQMEDSSCLPAVSVLEAPHHLSYPFVFKYGESYYMVPETSSEKKVSIYKAKQFPHQWEFVMDLITGIGLADATLHYHDQKWWVFATAVDHPFTSTNDQLLLFHARDLLTTEWKPHPMNPVVTDISHCRPAGRIFQHNGKWYRPAQNNASDQYGYGLTINEVLVWNESEYREKKIVNMLPEDYGLKAMHHYDQSGGMSVYDGIPNEGHSF